MNKTRKAFFCILMCVLVIFMTACGEKDNTPFSHGYWSGDTYTSNFFGFKLETGSDWLKFSDAELASFVNISDMSDSSIQAFFDKGGTLYEMMAARADGSSVNITIQDNEKTLSLSEKDFFNAGISLIKAQYESQGYICSVEKSVVTFLGKGTDCLDIALTKNGSTIYAVLIPLFKSHYTACILFGATAKSDVYIMLSMAKPI